MTDTAPIQTLTSREMALAQWIEAVSHRSTEDERHRVAMLCGTAAYLLTVNEQGEMPEPSKSEQKFVLTIKQGCEARGGRRSEAAFACLAVAMAAAKAAIGREQ